MRKCGDCISCCTITAIPELKKAAGIECKHCSDGCSIYVTRPIACRSFECSWLQGDLDDNMRPDKVGFMVEILPDKSVVFVTAIDDRILIDMENTFSEYLQRGISVVASNGYGLIADGATPESVRSAVLKSAREMGIV